MGRLGLALLRAYLACIAYFAPNRLRVRQELALVEYSLIESYESERSRHGRLHAAWTSVRRHLNELWPPSLASKARSECTHVARDRRYPLRIASGVGSLAAVAIVGFLALAADTEAPAVSGVARVFPDGDPRAGQVETIAEDVQTLQEGIYVASGGRVCIDPDLTGADLTDEVVNGDSTPEELEACAHYELPE